MKPNPWWLLGAMVCSWYTVTQCPSQARVQLFCLTDPGNLSCDQAKATSELQFQFSFHFLQNSVVNARATAPMSLFSVGSAEISPNDEDPANGSRAGGQGTELIYNKPWLGIAEWRLSRFDAQYANSFIRLKAKSPP